MHIDSHGMASRYLLLDRPRMISISYIMKPHRDKSTIQSMFSPKKIARPQHVRSHLLVNQSIDQSINQCVSVAPPRERVQPSKALDINLGRSSSAANTSTVPWKCTGTDFNGKRLHQAFVSGRIREGGTRSCSYERKKGHRDSNGARSYQSLAPGISTSNKKLLGER